MTRTTGGRHASPWRGVPILLFVLAALLSSCSQDGHGRLPRATGWGTVQGVVRAVDGRPVTGCSVVPEAVSVPAPPIPDMAAASGSDGGYAWHLVPARYRMAASCSGEHDGREGRGAVVRVVADRTVTSDVVVR